MPIAAIDWTDVTEVTKGAFMMNFEMTDYIDGSGDQEMASGRYEDIAGTLYVVRDADVVIDASAVSGAGVYHVHLYDFGDGTANAKFDSNVGTWDANLGGYYYDMGGGQSAKITHSAYWTGSTWTNKGRVVKFSEGPRIGESIAIHPDVKVLPNLFNFSPCDGVETMPTANFSTTNDTKVPDLSDDRFLMGSTAYGTGGSNTKDLEHDHGPGTLQFQTAFFNWSATPTLEMFNSGGSNVAVFGDDDFQLQGLGGTAAAVFNRTADETYYTKSGTGTTVNSGSTTQDILPKYFKVKYYMRIR